MADSVQSAITVADLRELIPSSYLLAFVVALSDLTLFEIGPLFWSLVLGMSATLLLEFREYKEHQSRE